MSTAGCVERSDLQALAEQHAAAAAGSGAGADIPTAFYEAVMERLAAAPTLVATLATMPPDKRAEIEMSAVALMAEMEALGPLPAGRLPSTSTPSWRASCPIPSARLHTVLCRLPASAKFATAVARQLRCKHPRRRRLTRLLPPSSRRRTRLLPSSSRLPSAAWRVAQCLRRASG